MKFNLLKIFKRKKPRRYWDFGYINSYVELNKEHIQEMILCLYKENKDLMVVIKDGVLVQHVASFQYMYSKVGNVMYSDDDYPCMKIKYKNGNMDKIACYKDAHMVESASKGHKTLWWS